MKFLTCKDCKELEESVRGLELRMSDLCEETANDLAQLRAVRDAAEKFIHALGFVYWVTACEDVGTTSYEMLELACQAHSKLEDVLRGCEVPPERTTPCGSYLGDNDGT